MMLHESTININVQYLWLTIAHCSFMIIIYRPKIHKTKKKNLSHFLLRPPHSLFNNGCNVVFKNDSIMFPGPIFLYNTGHCLKLSPSQLQRKLDYNGMALRANSFDPDR